MRKAVAAPPRQQERAHAGRLRSLDGLRGLAAAVVVVHHGLLTWRVLAGQYGDPNPDSGTWWLAFTPLHLFWAGTEAVLVFFVLSGFVLSLPFLSSTTTAGRWVSYYGRRLLRLYVPVGASVALAGLLVNTFPRVPGPSTSWWFDAHAGAPQVGTLVHDALLVDGTGWTQSSLWSLRFEVLFSLLLPLYIYAARRLRDRPALAVGGFLVLMGLGPITGSEELMWLPAFGVGAVLAGAQDRLRALGRRVNNGPAPTLCWAGLASAAVALLLAEWWARAARLTPEWFTAVVRPLGVLGAAMLCVLVLLWPALRSVCERPMVQWLGRISFSLYLVHEPILVSVSSLVGGGNRGVAVTLTVGIAAALVVAILFHRLVELPSLALARAVGLWLDGLVPRVDGGTTADRHATGSDAGRPAPHPVPNQRVHGADRSEPPRLVAVTGRRAG